MSKRRDEELVFAAVDGRATPDERRELERRLEGDGELRRTFEAERRIVAGIRGLEREAVPFDLVAAAERRLAREERRPRRVGLGLAWAGAAVAVIVAAAWVVLTRAPAVMPEAVAGTIVAVTVEGTVWVDVSGVRRRAASGDTITPGTRLESDAGGTITLARAEAVRVTMYEDTALELTTGDGASAGWQLARGVLRAESTLDEAPLTIRIEGLGDAVHVRQAAAGVLADGTGGFVVACTRGRAQVTRGSELVGVTAGKQLVARGPGAATLRDQTPELVLAVIPVDPVPAGTRELEVTGRSAPGALVTVDGVQVVVAADGSFVRRVRFDGKAREVVVRARDALARRRQSLLALVPARAPRQPTFRDIETEWQWEGRQEPG